MNEHDLKLACQAGCHSAVMLKIYNTENALSDFQMRDLDSLQKLIDLVRADERNKLGA